MASGHTLTIFHSPVGSPSSLYTGISSMPRLLIRPSASNSSLSTHSGIVTLLKVFDQ